MSTEITPKEAKIIENFLVQCIQLELLELGDVVPQRIVHCVGVKVIDAIKNTIQGLPVTTTPPMESSSFCTKIQEAKEKRWEQNRIRREAEIAWRHYMKHAAWRHEIAKFREEECCCDGVERSETEGTTEDLSETDGATVELSETEETAEGLSETDETTEELSETEETTEELSETDGTTDDSLESEGAK